jgi:hypothetical protein
LILYFSAIKIRAVRERVKVNSLDKKPYLNQIRPKKNVEKSALMKTKLLALILFFLTAFKTAPAQDQMADTLTVQAILHMADSVAAFQDSLLAQIKYAVRESVVFNELKDKGEIGNSDTIISDLTVENGKESSRQVVYSNRKSKSGGSKEQSLGVNLQFNDPDYNYSLTGTSDSSYIISVSPKAAVKKGDYTGKVEIDRRGFYLRMIDFEVPKPEGALKEFTTRVRFEPLEGGLVVIKDVETRGLVKALFGIVKMKFSGIVSYSDYRIMK